FLRPLRLRSAEQQMRPPYRRSQVIGQLQRTDFAIPNLHPLMAEHNPGLALRIHEHGSVQTFPVRRSHRPVTDWQEWALRTIRSQNLSTPAVALRLEAGKHIVTVMIGVDFRRPEITICPESRRWSKGREWPFPVLQVCAGVVINPCCRICPCIRTDGSIQVVFLFRRNWQDKRITNMDVDGLQHCLLQKDLVWMEYQYKR